jgi:hypothetical protein
MTLPPSLRCLSIGHVDAKSYVDSDGGVFGTPALTHLVELTITWQTALRSLQILAPFLKSLITLHATLHTIEELDKTLLVAPRSLCALYLHGHMSPAPGSPITDVCSPLYRGLPHLSVVHFGK